MLMLMLMLFDLIRTVPENSLNLTKPTTTMLFFFQIKSRI